MFGIRDVIVRKNRLNSQPSWRLQSRVGGETDINCLLTQIITPQRMPLLALSLRNSQDFRSSVSELGRQRPNIGKYITISDVHSGVEST